MNVHQQDQASQKQTVDPRTQEAKPMFQLIPPGPLEELARVYTMGAQKYSPRGWERGISFMDMYGSLQRHANLWRSGQDLDWESQLHHMAHVAFWALAIIQLTYTRPTFDDREEK